MSWKGYKPMSLPWPTMADSEILKGRKTMSCSFVVIYRKRKQVYTAKGGDAKCVIEILGGQK